MRLFFWLTAGFFTTALSDGKLLQSHLEELEDRLWHLHRRRLGDATPVPTADPTTDPTAEPTFNPTANPSANPSTDPSPDPTETPTPSPTEMPTEGLGAVCKDAKTPFTIMFGGSMVSCLIVSLATRPGLLDRGFKLIFWVGISALFIHQCTLDWLAFSESSTHMKDQWQIYQCYARITVNSANYKWSVACTLVSLMRVGDIDISKLFSLKVYKLRFRRDKISETFMILSATLSLMQCMPLIFTHIIVGIILYCWWSMFIWMIRDILIKMARACFQKKGKAPGQYLIWWIVSCNTLFWVMGIVIPVNFLTNNWDGMTYNESILYTVNSRDTMLYWNEMFVEGTMQDRVEFFWVII